MYRTMGSMAFIAARASGIDHCARPERRAAPADAAGEEHGARRRAGWPTRSSRSGKQRRAASLLESTTRSIPSADVAMVRTIAPARADRSDERARSSSAGSPTYSQTAHCRPPTSAKQPKRTASPTARYAQSFRDLGGVATRRPEEWLRQLAAERSTVPNARPDFRTVKVNPVADAVAPMRQM